MKHDHPTIESLVQLLDASSRPIYAVDGKRQIVYCNAALSAWLALEPGRILGRIVEYHSEPTPAAAFTDLCPPPQVQGGTPISGTVGCVGRDGRLVHRRADFVPLSSDGVLPCGVLVLLAATDMTPQELAEELSDAPSGDELHRAIRRFRRGQAAEYAVEKMLGESAAMRRVRAQVAAAAASQAHVLVRGRTGTGREHVARAIHYRAADAAGKLVPIDAAVATEESLRRGLDTVRGSRDPRQRSTLLILNLDRLPRPLQSQLLPILTNTSFATRVVATLTTNPLPDDAAEVDIQLLAALSTITIDVPPLAERLEDLPLLAQFFLEAANRDGGKQIGSVRADALDQLALYRWPGELDELRSVITAAHATAATHEITAADLPAVIHHAAKAAAMSRRAPEKIVLDELLESIEREVIRRALAQAHGNKSAAAELLGMTRPRLYRRLVQLGFVAEAKAATEEGQS